MRASSGSTRPAIDRAARLEEAVAPDDDDRAVGLVAAPAPGPARSRASGSRPGAASAPPAAVAAAAAAHLGRLGVERLRASAKTASESPLSLKRRPDEDQRRAAARRPTPSTHSGSPRAAAPRAGRHALPARRQRLLVAAALLPRASAPGARARCRAARGRCRGRGSGPRSRAPARRRSARAGCGWRRRSRPASPSAGRPSRRPRSRCGTAPAGSAPPTRPRRPRACWPRDSSSSVHRM